MLLLLNFLDDPYSSGIGGLKPVAMEQVVGAHRRATRGGRRRSDDPLRRQRESGVAVMTNNAEAKREGHDWFEIVATVLLAVAAVATAWSSYQSTRWNGESSKASGRTNALRIEAARSQGLAEAQTQVDIATFIQWVDATVNDNDELEQFYSERFRPEFRPAFDAWVATDPLTNPDAPPTPFAMPEYRLGGDRRGRTSRRRGRGVGGDRPPQHPTGGELCARCCALRGRAVLRGDERQTQGTSGANIHARDGMPRLHRDHGVDRLVPGQRRRLSSPMESSPPGSRPVGPAGRARPPARSRPA